MRFDTPIHYYNPELTLEWLHNNCPVEEKYSRLLKIDRSTIRNDTAKTVIGVTFFCRDVNDHTGACKATPDLWEEKYYKSLLENISNIKDLGDVAVELFVDPELSEIVERIDNDRVNTHVMAEPANGFSGGFWRFLVTDAVDRDCLVVIQDIDQKWRDCVPMLQEYAPVAPSFPSRSEDALVECKDTGSSKYTPIGAGMFSYNSADVDFNMAEVIARYWHYNNTLMHVLEPKTEYNRPMRGHHFGFGNTWNVYGSDERFLAKFMYYYLARKSALNIMLHRGDFYHAAELASRNFIHDHGGKVFYV